MTTHDHHTLSTIDRARIHWASARYDLWLDLRSVPGKQRRALRQELKANLTAAADKVGVTTALAQVGSLRTLAGSTAESEARSPWKAAASAAFVTFTFAIVAFLMLTLYYTEGVLDAGAVEPITSSLFPFFGSSITVDPSNGGLEWTAQPGPAPLVAALGVFLFMAKPWRSIKGLRRSAQPAAT